MHGLSCECRVASTETKRPDNSRGVNLFIVAASFFRPPLAHRWNGRNSRGESQHYIMLRPELRANTPHWLPHCRLHVNRSRYINTKYCVIYILVIVFSEGKFHGNRVSDSDQGG